MARWLRCSQPGLMASWLRVSYSFRPIHTLCCWVDASPMLVLSVCLLTQCQEPLDLLSHVVATMWLLRPRPCCECPWCPPLGSCGSGFRRGDGVWRSPLCCIISSFPRIRHRLLLSDVGTLWSVHLLVWFWPVFLIFPPFDLSVYLIRWRPFSGVSWQHIVASFPHTIAVMTRKVTSHAVGVLLMMPPGLPAVVE